MAVQGSTLIREPDGLSPIVPDVASDRVEEDLPWILNRLSDRLLADGAILTLHFPHGRDPEILCVTGAADELLAQVQDLIAITQASCFTAGGRRAPLQDYAWHDLDNGKDKILMLPVAEDGVVCLVATLFYHHRNLIQKIIVEQVSKRFKPALSGYFRLWLFARHQQRQVDALRSSLDLSDAAIFILDTRGAILIENRTATKFLEKAEALHRTRRSLSATDVADTLKLQVAIDHANNADANSSISVLRLRKKGAGKPLIAMVAPVSRSPEVETDPSAILSVFDPDRDIGPLLRPICDLYRLSKSESRLVELIVAGETVTGASVRMRIAEPTARSYLKQIFVKTSTNRQSELVKIMLMSVVRTDARSFQTI